MKKLWSYDGLVSADHVSGKYYSEVRRDELKKIPGGDFYAAQFGIRMAAKRAAHLDVGLRLHNQYSSQYQRENRDQTFLDLCHSLYENHRNNEGGDVLPSERVFYLNSPRSAELFRKMREGRRSEDDWAEDQKKWGIVPLSEDLLAVEQKVVVREYWQDPQVDRSIHNIGGVPSIYAVLRKKFKKSLEASVQDKAVDNLETLHEVFRHHEEIRQAVARLPDAHPSKKVGSALLPLLSGLRELPDPPDFEQHTVVANSLASLSRLLPLVPSCLTDPSRLFSLYDAIVEEINLVLIAIRPYGLQDFKDAAESAFHQRTAGVTKDIEGLASAETCLMTSGMSAVAEGLHAAQAMANSSDFEGLSDWAGGMKPDYFEVPELLSSFSGQPVTGEPKAKILVTTLNPSTPQKQSAEDEAGHWDSNRMVEDVQARLKAEKLPIVLVLDTTLEKTNGIAGQSELADVMKRFKPDIESGQLKVILCKSYQKYTSLLAAKLMAGGVSVVARQDDDTQHGIDHLQRVERELNWMKNDDGQFLTHSLKYAQQDEMMLLENAAGNANFIHANFFGKQGFDRFQKGVPFGVIGEPRFEVNTGGAPRITGFLI